MKIHLINILLGRTFSFLSGIDGNLRKKVMRSSFWVGLSAVSVSILHSVRSIVLARMLTPEAFGLMGICLMVVHGIQLFTETGLGAALIQRKNGFEEAKDTAYVMLVARGFILAPIIFVLGWPVASFYQEPILKDCLQVLCLVPLVQGFRNINIISNERALNFKSIYYFRQIIAVTDFVLILSLVYWIKNVWALVIGQVMVSFVTTGLSFVIIPGRLRFKFSKLWAKKLFRYGKHITCLTIVLFITSEIDNAVIGKILGTEVLGLYVLAYMLANLPATHIGKVISNVIFPAYARLQDDPVRLKKAFLEVLELVARLVIPASFGLILLAPEILYFIYGPKWVGGYEVLRILTVFGCLRALGGVNGYLFNAIGKPEIVLYLCSIKLVVIAVIIIPLANVLGLSGVAYAVTLPIIVEFPISILILSKTIKLTFTSLINAVWPGFLLSIMMAIALWCFKIFMPIANLNVMILVIMSCMLLYMIISMNYVRRIVRLLLVK